MKRNILLAMSLISVLAGCSGNDIEYRLPEADKEYAGEFEVIGRELEGLNSITDISVYKSYVIVTAVSLKDGKVVHVFDKETGALLMDAISLGRGPKELLYPRITTFDSHDGVHRFYDPSKSSVLSYQVDSILSQGLAAVREASYSPLPANTHIFDMGDKYLAVNNASFLWRDTTSVSRFEVRDKTGRILSSWDGYPYYEDDRKRFIAYNNDHVALSPDRTRLAVATMWGGILELFTVGKSGIRPVFTGYYVSPDFDVEGNGMYAMFNDNSVDSFSDIFVTDDMVYASFGGHVLLKQDLLSSPGDRSLKFTDIIIFDWKGKALQCIHTGYQIERLCVDGTMVYAVIRDGSGRAYLGRLAYARCGSEEEM